MKVRVSFDTIHTSLKKWSHKNWSTSSKNERRSKTHLEEYMYSTNTYLYIYIWDHTNSCAHALNTKERERARSSIVRVLLSRQSRFFFFDERGGGGGGGR